MILLSIDPGTRYMGAALFKDGKLIAATSIRNPAKEGSGPHECALMAREVLIWTNTCIVDGYDVGYLASAIKKFVCEIPQVYTRDKSKSDPNTLLPLAMVDGALAALLPRSEVTYYQPHEWGAIGKPDDKAVGKVDYVIELRMRERLTLEELDCIVWPWAEDKEKTKAAIKRSYDVTDAVCIGLKALGRFERKRVFARE